MSKSETLGNERNAGDGTPAAAAPSSPARRRIVTLLASGITGSLLPPRSALAQTAGVRMRNAATLPRIEAVAFDSYGTLFDVDSVITEAENLFPGQGKALADLWRRKQIEYSWLRTMSRRYRDFWQLTDDGLVFAARTLKLDLTTEKRARLVNQYLRLKPFPEAVEALKEMKTLRIPLIILSNGTPAMLKAAVTSAEMDGIFDRTLSVDAVRTFKTDPRVYEMGIRFLRLSARKICFVSSHSWDVVGAMASGMQGFWVNRTGGPAEELGIEATGTGPTLTEALQFVRQSRTG